MTLLHILILSLIQGFTEFLPVSSSGHLVLLPRLFGWQDQGQVMDVALHVGTLVAVVLYFWQDIWRMITNFYIYITRGFQRHDLNDSVRLALSIVIATLPAIGTGFILKKAGLGEIRQVGIIATTTIVFAGILFIADHFSSQKKGLNDMTWGRGFLIGLGQAMALIPGVSRSGICISVALSLGFTRVAAARFAFLMSIPVIIGAATLTAYDAVKADIPLIWGNIGMGIIFSAFASLAAIHFMLTFLARYSLNIFVIYRIILGLMIWIVV
jgi:undecaprenyl-diphosphatase